MTYAIAVAPVFLYSFIIYWLVNASTRAGPLSLVICSFFGIFSAVVSLALEYLWSRFMGDFIGSHHSLIFVESFFGVSLIEEGSKWLWLVFIIGSWKSFDLYTDGILYACGIAAGFSMVEGLLYATIETNVPNMLLRSFTAVPAHFLFAIVMGFLFARCRIEGAGFFWFSFLIPVVLHGLYDFFILQQYAELLMGIAMLVLIGCLALSIWVCRTAMRADRMRMANSI